jgi:hypothetical protein
VNRFFSFLLIVGCIFSAEASVSVESHCYVKAAESVGKVAPFFLFRSYFDGELLERVGALVEYNNTGKNISLLFDDEKQGDGPASDDYRRVWLEVAGGKVVGKYVEYGTYGGNSMGNKIEYFGYKNKRPVIFRVTRIDGPCKTGFGHLVDD